MARKRRSNGRRCVAAGCARFGRPGRALCPDHERSAYGRELAAAVGRLAQQVGDGFTQRQEGEDVAARQRRAAAEFGRRLERGDYGGLFDGRLRAVMAQAAAERGLAEEIGALRVVLAKLLTTEGADPLRVAHGVARVAGTTVRALQAQRALEGDLGDEFQRALQHVLTELDEESSPSADPARGLVEGGGVGAAEAAWGDE